MSEAVSGPVVDGVGGLVVGSAGVPLSGVGGQDQDSAQ